MPRDGDEIQIGCVLSYREENDREGEGGLGQRD